MKDDDKKRKEVVEDLKHIHPHDDEPDPNNYMGNYNFPQMLLHLYLGFVTMFVLSVNGDRQVQRLSPTAPYFDEPIPKTPD